MAVKALSIKINIHDNMQRLNTLESTLIEIKKYIIF